MSNDFGVNVSIARLSFAGNTGAMDLSTTKANVCLGTSSTYNSAFATATGTKSSYAGPNGSISATGASATALLNGHFRVFNDGLYSIEYCLNVSGMTSADVITFDIQTSLTNADDGSAYASVEGSKSVIQALTGVLQQGASAKVLTYLQRGTYVKLFGVSSTANNAVLSDGSFIIKQEA